jgi:electron transfer flavoprotein alpha/beta subunit
VKIVCLVKQVPEAGSIEFDQETKALKRQGVPVELNPFDRFAVRHAVALREAAGGEVVAMTMGPPQAEEALREALSLGADRAILLTDRVFAVADALGTSRTLAFALRKEGFDLVLCGRKSTDSETWQVPPEVAAFLGVPHLTNATELEPSLDRPSLRVTRMTDEAEETWDVPLPALVSVAAPPGDAPEPAPGGDRIDSWGALDLVDEVHEYDHRFGQNGSPTRVLAVRDVTPERAGFRADSADAARAKVEELLAEREAEPPSWEKPDDIAEEPGEHYDCWALIETRDGEPTRTSLELLGRARLLAGKLGGQTVALVLGDGAPDLGRHGAELVHRVAFEGEEWRALVEVLRRHSPHVLLIPATTWGRDVGPRAAGELELGMTGDCVGVDIAKAGRLLQQKPAYGGNIVSVIMGSTTPQLATVRPRMYEPLESRDAVAEEREETIELPAVGSRLLERRQFDRPGWTVEEADVVVVRADDPAHLRVGLLGRQIAPRVAVAVGLEGTVEQLSGFVKARVVVSVNGGAGLEERADVIVDGDAGQIVSALAPA